MANYGLKPRARRNLAEIWEYSESQWGTAQADRYVLMIAAACGSLAAGKANGHSAEFIRAGYFRYNIGSHVLFFRDRKRGGIEIVRILHQSMDFERHL